MWFSKHDAYTSNTSMPLNKNWTKIPFDKSTDGDLSNDKIGVMTYPEGYNFGIFSLTLDINNKPSNITLRASVNGAHRPIYALTEGSTLTGMFEIRLNEGFFICLATSGTDTTQYTFEPRYSKVRVLFLNVPNLQVAST